MNDVEKPIVLQLPETLDAKEASPLLSSLIAMRGKPIEIDASRVRKVGALGLQVLISARITWEADGILFRVLNPSASFSEAVALAGAPFHSERVPA